MSTRLSLTMEVAQWPMLSPFQITGKLWTSVPQLAVRLSDGTHEGRGEAGGVYYLDDVPDAMPAQIEALRPAIEAGITRAELQTLMPPCGARNALDCALWELEARRAGTTVMALAGIADPRPLITTCTIGAAAPDAMAAQAVAFADARAIKLKLTSEDSNAERVRAVRAARPDVWLGIDANQGLDRTSLEALLPTLVDAGVALIEQPVRVGHDAELDGLKSPIPIAADESVQGLADVPALVGRYQVVNIKLDKCGGLTEGLAIVAEAQRLGLTVMVGNMMGTSWSMAPSFVVGQHCAIVDLDGPLLLAADRSPAVTYRDGLIHCPPSVWGGAPAA